MKTIEKGFTLIELMIVVAIIGILASLAIAAYQTYLVRTQVSEGIGLAAAARAAIIDVYHQIGQPAANLTEAGMSTAASDTAGKYVSGVSIFEGRIDVTYGNDAHADISGRTISFTPYISGGAAVSWRCGAAAAPPGAPLSGGGVTSVHLPPTVDERYLPGTCRP